MDWRIYTRPRFDWIGITVLIVFLAGCGEDEGDGSAGQEIGDPSTNFQGDATTNQYPRILGSPNQKGWVNTRYFFQPYAYDPDGIVLRFSIRNRPQWATFDSKNGRLTGTPLENDAGLHSGIVITVSDGHRQVSLPAFSIRIEGQSDPGSSTNAYAPHISGTPSSTAAVDSVYYFSPSVADPDGGILTFSVSNKPEWLDFDAFSGTLSGVPSPADLGSYEDITISVTDGTHFATLAPFSINVVAGGFLGGTITWTPPIRNVDGSPLVDLAGFRIYHGKTAGFYDDIIDIPNPGISMYTIDGLTQGHHYFVVTAYNSTGEESGFSNTTSLELF